MTEPGRDAPHPTGETLSEEGDPLLMRPHVLDRFKTSPDDADNESVHDAIGGRPRLNWHPVTDGGGGRTSTDQPEPSSGFHFDLGGALARLGAHDDGGEPARDAAPPAAPDTAPAPLDTRVPTADVAPMTLESPSGEIPKPDIRAAFDVAAAPPAAAPEAVAEALPEVAPTPDIISTFDLTARSRPAAPEIAPPLVDEAPLEPLPRRGERPATPDPVVEVPPVAPREPAQGPYVTARRSVFDDLSPSSGPTLPTALSPTVPQVGADLAPHAAAAPVLPAQPTVPVLPAAGAPVLPSLPAAPPAPPPMYTPPVETAVGANSADLHALRSAQLRQNRKQRKGKLFSRTLLLLIVIGGLVAAGLVFGRQYLFPTDWDPVLTPIVDDVQTERGVEFEHTVGLVLQPPADYALTASQLSFEDSWLEWLPEWRALGIASGEPTAESVGTAIAASRLAVYDPDADRIYMSTETDPAQATADLRLAVEQAFAAQHGAEPAPIDDPATGLTGVSPQRAIAEDAIRSHLAELAAPDAAQPTVQPAPATAPTAPVPLPIEYELAAVDQLGPALIAAAGLDPAALTIDRSYPDNVATLLDDAPSPAASGAIPAGDRSLASPEALGPDDWALVFGARLPAQTASRLADMLVADSYRPTDRGGVICVIATFQTGSEADAQFALSSLVSWVAAAPVESQAQATPFGTTGVQLVTCDPGATASGMPTAAAVDVVLERQLERLAG
jgi:hypothetical protein